jgi:hypothetical protein
MRGRHSYWGSLVALWALAAAPVGAVTRTVPGDHATIQAAETACADGDTVLVAAGTYSGTVSIDEDIVLLGAGPGSTTITGAPGVRAVTIFSSATVQGFTITGGAVAGDGGGVLINGTLGGVMARSRATARRTGAGYSHSIMRRRPSTAARSRGTSRTRAPAARSGFSGV